MWIAFDGLRVAVRSPVPDALAAVRQVVRAMAVDGSGGADGGRVVAEYCVQAAGDGYVVTGDGVPVPERGPLAEMRRAVRFHVTRAFVEARPERFWVHAGAVHDGARLLLLPGSRGQGKSTLVASLVGAGWRYLSDEAVPLDMADDRAAPFPLTPQPRVDPGAALPPEAVAALGRRDVELDPPVVHRASAPITEIVFVRYAWGAGAALATVPPGEAALGLLESCLNVPAHGARAVRYAVALADRVPAAALTFGDVGAAVRLLAEGRAAR